MVLSVDDDLVHADALQQAGDPRGELIVLEIELERAPTPALRQRRAELLGQYAARMWPELPRHRLRTRRGYVDGVIATAEELDRAVALPGRERVNELTLFGPKGEIPDVWWRHLRRLVVVSENAGALVAATVKPRLEAFALRDPFVSSSRWWLGDALPRCKHLSFAGQQLYDAAARILDWQHIGQLETLDLSGCRLDATTLDTILLRNPTSLRVLRLSGNRLGDGARPILAKHALPALQRLELVNSGIDDADLAKIAAARPGVEVVGAYRRPPTFEIVLDKHVELFAHEGGYSVVVDGRPMDIVLVRVRSDENGSKAAEPIRSAVAPIDPIVEALACGQPVMPQLDGSAIIQLGSSMGYAYNTSVYSRQTARIALTHVVAIELDEYVSID